MKLLKRSKHNIDQFQQEHKQLAFPVAVVKRYGDEKVGKQAALIAYYGFLSLFPLLLVFITIIGIVASGDAELTAKINSQVFQYFPALGKDLQGSVHTLKSSGLALLLELLVLVYGARGLAVTLQDAFNYVWHTADGHKANFLLDNLRSFAMLTAMGAGIALGTTLSYIIGGVLDIGLVGTIFITALNLAFTIGLFFVVFRLGTSNRVHSHSLVLGAVIAGMGLLVIQHFGGYIMAHELPKLKGTYGSFALALAMLFWIYLQAQVIMYALVTTAVRSQRDWPKKLFS